MPTGPFLPVPAPSRRATLTVGEDGVRRTFRLASTVTVGRDPACEVALGSPTVSRRHATLAPDEEGWLVRDLGSGNGTFLDGRRVDEAPLPSGTAVRFGSVPAWFEEEPEADLTPSRRLQQTISQRLSVSPARRTRKKAAAAALAGGILLLLAAAAWHRGCPSRAGDAGESPAAPRPVTD